MPPKVYNKHLDKDIPADAVYIGRGSLYGNPFIIGQDGDRDAVCDKFEKLIAVTYEPTLLKVKAALKGKDLVCFCKPLRCHGDTLLRIANEDEDTKVISSVDHEEGPDD